MSSRLWHINPHADLASVIRPVARSFSRRALALSALAVLAIAAAASAVAPGIASAVTATVSANWSGYAVTGSSKSAHFDRVAGSWVQPGGSCARGQETYSVTWVGLGGFRQGSKALEQTGTAVNCTSSGRAVYSAWYELVPAAPVTMRLAVHPGDEISASVAESAGETILQVRDLSTHHARTAVRAASPLDLSSAEWIVEAPSLCFTTTHCTPLPLTDFGTVSFSNASVSTSSAQRAAIDARSLKVTRLELRDYSQGPGHRFASTVTPATGIASALSPTGNAFTVTWQALGSQGEGSPAPPQQQSAPSLTSAEASVRR
jgi:hypothetical protein